MFLLVQIFMLMFPRTLIITGVDSIWFFFQWPLPHLLLGQAVCHHTMFQGQEYFSSPSWRGWKSHLNSNVYKKHTSNHVPNVGSNLMSQYYTLTFNTSSYGVYQLLVLTSHLPPLMFLALISSLFLVTVFLSLVFKQL